MIALQGDFNKMFAVHQLRFLVTVDGFSADGGLGCADFSVDSKQAFYVEPKLPLYATAGDHIIVPVSMVNDGKESVTVIVNASSSSEMLTFPKLPTNVVPTIVKSMERGRQIIEVDVKSGDESAQITISASAGSIVDTCTRNITIQPKGLYFPAI